MRAATTNGMVSAKAVDAVANPAIRAPPTIRKRRPRRSPMGPISGRTKAAASPKELTAMPTWVDVPPRSFSTNGGSTLRVMFRPMK